MVPQWLWFFPPYRGWGTHYTIFWKCTLNANWGFPQHEGGPQKGCWKFASHTRRVFPQHWGVEQRATPSGKGKNPWVPMALWLLWCHQDTVPASGLAPAPTYLWSQSPSSNLDSPGLGFFSAIVHFLKWQKTLIFVVTYKPSQKK